jgi:tetratricopeptide (TPR) repeat protein
MRVLIVLCALAGIASAQPTDPDTKKRADDAFAAGTAAYNANDFVNAALKFENAYSLVADPAYLFNIGQAYRQAKECVKSAAAFQKFVELAPNAPNIGKAKDLLHEVNVCALFVEGRRLMGAGRPAEACEKFQAAFNGDPGAVGTLLNLGLCNEQIGKFATAASWFRQAIVKAKESQSSEAEQQAQQHIDGIAKKISTVDIEAPTNNKTVIKLDGKPITVLSHVEVDPGRHVIDAETPGTRPVTQSFEVASGGHTNVRIASGENPGGGGSPRSAYILGGAGLTLWVGAAALGVVGKSKYDDASTFEQQDKWKTIVRYGATSMFIVGTGAIATSVVLYLRARKHRAETTVLAPTVGPNDVGIALTGAF